MASFAAASAGKRAVARGDTPSRWSGACQSQLNGRVDVAIKKKPYRPWSAPARRVGNGSLPFAATSIDWKRAPRRGTKEAEEEKADEVQEAMKLINDRTAMRLRKTDRPSQFRT